MAEPYLCNPGNTIDILQKYELRMQKRFGQNFLIDSHVLDKIISASNIGPEDLVLEIGPGIGTMTQYLASKAFHVIAVEIDRALIPVLKETLSAWSNVTVVQQDILKTDLREILSAFPDVGSFKVAANLPYYITTPILMELFESGLPLSSATVMVQKEVAQRMMALPGSKDYGALSLAIQYYASCEIIANVPPNCFIPRPNVGSAVVYLQKRPVPPVDVKDKNILFLLIKAAFGQRRKTLANAIANFPELPYGRTQIEKILTDLGLDVRIRGEELSLEHFSALCNALIEEEGENGGIVPC